MNSFDEDEEVFIGDDEDTNIPISNDDDNEPMIFSSESLTPVIGLCEALLPDFEPFNNDSTVHFCIPSKYLPMSLQASCGFYHNPILITVTIQLNMNKWNIPPVTYSFQNPNTQTNFVGSPLITQVITDFFTTSYKPRKVYKAELYIFRHSGIADPKKINQLVQEKFDVSQATEALILCNNNLKEASEFLLTGKVPNANARDFDVSYHDESVFIPSYDECPLIYLILEIVEAFLDLNDHCCICRTPLPFAGIRPQHCSKKLCDFGYNEIGLCSSVANEIRRDPLSADLVLSLFSGSFSNEEFMDPKPSPEIVEMARAVFSSLPPMQTIAKKCQKDIDIARNYGKEALTVLRWVLMSNKSQIISLPDSMKIRQIPANYQFLTLISTPKNELDFQARKKKHGSCFLWHGSGGDRWHSILHNGLKNMSRCGKVINGASYGEGIYLATNSQISMSYSRLAPNLYSNSQLGRNIQCIALCEVAKVPDNKLRSFGQIKTLIDESACIVRFIFSYSQSFHYDTESNPLQKVPTLDEVMAYLAKAT